MRTWRLVCLLVVAGVLGLARPVAAQVIGTFRWQLLPHCNVVSLTVTQQGAQYLLDGTDDQCGGPHRAGVTGIAFPNPDGTLGFGFNVAGPDGKQSHTDATINLITLGGTWNGSSGDTGTFAFTTGAPVPGNRRPEFPPPTRRAFTYDLAPGAYSEPISLPPHIPVRMAGTQLGEGTRGIGAVDIMSIPDQNGRFLEWVGLHSTGGASIAQGFSGTSGTVIVYIDFAHQVAIEVFSPTQVRVHNLTSIRRFGDVSLTY